ncbi:FimV/HubP family polar landmark protein [Teredinibacter waterburyi]|uniref:FimV/HubP family polar landmark protein n=1 Tax=Teredinibacter waterburyi TaxID=1500538 RepID=UPI00165F25FA|nr:FimV/HubP family polar landmark protein [Teredinibacter waterburyi]
MGHRILVLLFAVAGMSFSGFVLGLGLGDANLKTALNEPLRAEIQLLEVRDLSDSEILVSLAGREDFDRIGVDRPYFLTDLRFKVELRGRNGPVVLVTSTKPVREPFLNFVLQVRWPTGRLLREYTLLMDLPVYADQAVQPVAPAQTSSSSNSRPSTTSQTTSSSTRYNPRSSFEQGNSAAQTQSATSSSGGVRAGDDSVAVRANDTLWDIAKSIRPDRSVTIQQTMLAIQRKNPEAFIKNNINLLREGQVLRVPSRDEIQQYNRNQAVSEVAQQNVQWSGDPNGDAAGGAQLEGRKRLDSASTSSTSPEGRVKLSSPEDYTASEAGRGAGAGESSSDALKNELAITLEQLDKSTRENSDLRSKIDALEDQIETMERLVEVSSQDLRAMELAALKNQQDAVDASQAESASGDDAQGSTLSEEIAASLDSAAETETSEADALDAGESIVDSSELASDAAAAAEDVVPTEAPKLVDPSKVVASSKPEEKSIVDLLIDNLMFIALGLLAILVAVYFFIKQRSANVDEDELEEDFLAYSEEQDVEPLFEDADAESSEEDFPLEEFAEEEVAADTIAETDSVQPQTEDVVAEADIYIAYGKYDQAEEMLLGALKKEPENNEIRLKLLEVYSNLQDVESFDPHFAALNDSADSQAVDRASQLRSGIAGAGVFVASLYAADSFASNEDTVADLEGADDLDFELKLDEEPEFSLDLDDSVSGDDGDDFALDLDLGDDPADDLDEFSLALAGDSSDEEVKPEFSEDSGDDDFISLDEEFGLDLDLDLDSELGAESLSEGLDALSDSSSEIKDDLVAGASDLSESSVGELSFEVDESTDDLENLLDFELDDDDLGIDELEEGLLTDESLAELASESVETASSELDELGDLDGEFDLDFDLDDIAIDSSASEEAVAPVAAATLEDDFKLDLGDALDGHEGDEEDFDLEFDSPSSLSTAEVAADLSLEAANEVDIELESDDDFDLDGLDMDITDTQVFKTDLASLTEESFDVDDLAVDGEVEAEVEASTPVDMDDLDLGDDLDLSALDEELDALTSELSVEESDISNLETDLDGLDLDLPDLESNLGGEDELPSSTVMDEPVTDFEDFEAELEGELGSEFDMEEGFDSVLDDGLDSTEDDSKVSASEAADIEELAEIDSDLEDDSEDFVFDAALGEVDESVEDFSMPDIDPESDDDDELGFLSSSDETATKLDLARAYIDMGDAEGAKDILDEVVEEGNAQQKQEAENLLAKI